MENTIKLAATDYPVAAFSISQMRRTGPCFAHIGMDSMEGMAAQLTIICEGIRSADPTFTMEKLDAIKGVTFDEISEAVRAIGTICGLKYKTQGSDDAGEDKPAPEPA